MDAKYKKLIEWSRKVMPERIIEFQNLLFETKNEIVNIRNQAEEKLSTVDLKDLQHIGKYYAISQLISQLGEELSEVDNLLIDQTDKNKQVECHTDPPKQGAAEEEKIGKYAKRRFTEYFEKVKNPPLEQFLDKEWCHINFGIRYPLLKEIDIKCPVSDQTGYLDGRYHRFWTNPILEIEGKNYLMCSQWYRQFRTKLDNWFDSNAPE